MTQTDLRIERDTDGVGRIVLARPEAKNALTVGMRDGITDAIREFRADPQVRAVLVTGEGDAFCAGMDLSASTVTQAG
ncbi:MAG TPA: enoyl-CoA hydratase/isomerase family protein, partial [Acidimicrobiia bacterium]|nr:enoyl-CoA hydratase/isomerase family protein [Acidimicrobiia bacterium]